MPDGGPHLLDRDDEYTSALEQDQIAIQNEELASAAKAAFRRALDAQYGILGPASPIRRIDPKTGCPIADADDIRQSLGPKVASRL
jgi:hypothetical protein